MRDLGSILHSLQSAVPPGALAAQLVNLEKHQMVPSATSGPPENPRDLAQRNSRVPHRLACCRSQRYQH
jgi:hypothetical protein